MDIPETILEINRFEETKMNIPKDLADMHFLEKNEKFTGYTIKTSKQIITVAITSVHSCCESFDVEIHTPLSESLIGQTITNIKWGNKPLYDYSGFHKSYMDHESVPACVDLTTSIGTCQIIAYNVHNGYYPHSVYVKWNGYEDIQDV
jgi:hypothetical protein